MNIRTKIENTEAFRALPGFKQSIYRKNASIKNINEQYIMAQQQGYDAWKTGYKPCETEDKIIKELLNKL